MQHTWRNKNPQKKSPLELIDFSIHKQQEYLNMSKTRASDGDGDETVRYELSHGGYVTTYD